MAYVFKKPERHPENETEESNRGPEKETQIGAADSFVTLIVA